MKLAERIRGVKPSPTLAIDAQAKAMKAAGVDVIGFGAGEPDFDTPENIKQAAVEALNAGFTKYCPVGGIPELKQAIVDKLKNDNGLEYKPAEVVVSCGAKHSIYQIAQVLFQEGDEVIIPAPYWVSYLDIISLTSAKPVVVGSRPEEGFKMAPEAFERAITPRTKGLILNSPSNPTGCCYEREDLEAIAEIAVKHKITVISDEIYEKLIYDGFTFVSIASLGEEIKDLTLVVNGVSKTYAMTGWRIGYTAGRKEVIAAITTIQSQSTSNPNSIAMKASYEALTGPQEEVARMVTEFDRRRRYMMERLQAIPGVTCPTPRGAFYTFADYSSYYGKGYNGEKITDSNALAACLLDKFKVAAVPGAAFGEDSCLRLSYATSMENISEGLDRIQTALAQLK